jgi:hypothetical protein
VSKARLDLPEPDRPGEDDQGVARQVERDVLEVVLARTAHDQAVGHQVLREVGDGCSVSKAEGKTGPVEANVAPRQTASRGGP